MKFTDYPRDLQRIVELTPEGLCNLTHSVGFVNGEPMKSIGRKLDYSREQYNQCRAQWLAEKEEVDWRVLCSDLLCNLEQLAGDYGYTSYVSEEERMSQSEVKAAYLSINKARKALEQTK